MAELRDQRPVTSEPWGRYLHCDTCLTITITGDLLACFCSRCASELLDRTDETQRAVEAEQRDGVSK